MGSNVHVLAGDHVAGFKAGRKGKMIGREGPGLCSTNLSDAPHVSEIDSGNNVKNPSCHPPTVHMSLATACHLVAGTHPIGHGDAPGDSKTFAGMREIASR